MRGEHVLCPLRVTPAEIEAILNELDGSESGCPTSQRDTKRWGYRAPTAILSIADDLGFRSDYVVATRNLSGSGVSVLHGGFLHPGQRCVMGLRKLDGSVAAIPGSIARCRLVKSNLHEIGVKFRGQVNPSRFIKFSSRVFHRERIKLKDLRGTVLVVTPSVIEQRMVAARMKGSSIDLLFASGSADALAMKDEAIDVILVDHHADDWDGVGVIDVLRTAGFSQPIVFQANGHERLLRLEAIEAGANEVLDKPYTTEVLHLLLAEYVASDGIHSGDPSAHFIVVSAGERGVDLDLLHTFLGSLPTLLDDIESFAASGDTLRLQRHALDLSTTAGSLGFEPLDEAAHEVELAIDRGADEVTDALRKVRSVATRCRAAA